MLPHVSSSRRRGMGWLRCETVRDSDQKTWIKPQKETNMGIVTFQEKLKMEQESVYEQRVTAIEIIRLSILHPNKSCSKRRCHCSIVLLFFSVLSVLVFLHAHFWTFHREHPKWRQEYSALWRDKELPTRFIWESTTPQIFSFQALSWLPLSICRSQNAACQWRHKIQNGSSRELKTYRKWKISISSFFLLVSVLFQLERKELEFNFDGDSWT